MKTFLETGDVTSGLAQETRQFHYTSFELLGTGCPKSVRQFYI